MNINWMEIQTIGVIALGIGYVIAQFRKGNNNSYAETIQILTARDEAQKQLIKDYQNKFETLNKELGIVQGQLKEKDGKLGEYLTILQNRDPELVTYIKNSSVSLVAIEKFMREMSGHVSSIENRNKNVDKKRV